MSDDSDSMFTTYRRSIADGDELQWGEESGTGNSQSWNDAISTKNNITVSETGTVATGTPLSSSEVAYWNFESPETNDAVDQWNGNGLNLSDPSYVSPAKVGEQALQFDGGSDTAIQESGFPDLKNEFTVMAWVRPDVAPLSQYGIVLLNGDAGGNSKFKFLINDDGSGNFRLNIGSGNVNRISTGKLSYSAGTWYHLAGTWDGETARFFVNGSENSSTTANGDFSSYTTDKFYIGSDQNERNFAAITVDDVKIYNSVLTETQINDEYSVTS